MSAEAKEKACARIAGMMKDLGVNATTLQHLLPSASYAQTNTAMKKYSAKAIPLAELKAARDLLKDAAARDLLPVSPRSKTLPVLKILAEMRQQEELTMIYEEEQPDLEDLDLSDDEVYPFLQALTTSIDTGIEELTKKDK